MRVLLLHADRFSYRVTGDTSITKLLEPISEEAREGSAADALVCMVAVEKGDSDHGAGLIAETVGEIIKHQGQVTASEVVLYPYAHLSSTLESPRAAAKLMVRLGAKLRESIDVPVLQAPFGVYKAYDIQVKGHPLSEHGKTLTGSGPVEEAGSSALKADKEKRSEWLILTPDGETHDPETFDYSDWPALKTFYDYERGGSRLSDAPAPHIRLMQEHELVDYEPGSDQGNFRWYPKGYQIKKLLEDQISQIMGTYGAMQVETPIMYDLHHPALARYLDKFPARQYRVSSGDKQYFLRFAACFGQYLIKHDMQISYRHLPLRLYELTHYSFRREQSGELTGLKRLRAFTMPDMHTLCADLEQAKAEMVEQVKLCYRWMSDLGFQYVVAVRAVNDFRKDNPDYLLEIARLAKRPVLLELWDRRYFYFVTKFETNVIDSQGKAAALSTVQIDVENPARFDIDYTDSDGAAKTPLMLHTSVSGSIDRNLYALLEQQAIAMKKGTKAHYPLWLAPTQVRMVPVKSEFTALCEELAGQLRARVDIDDREESVGRRIRSAEKEWVPYVCVVGDRERDSGVLNVRVRGQKAPSSWSAQELQAQIDGQVEGRAFCPLNLPRRLSQRPLFRG